MLTERVRWGTAFKLIVFMPMAISMLAAGIIFRLVYEQDPERGVANAVWVGVHDTFAESAGYPKAHPRPGAAAEGRAAAARSSPRSRSRAGDRSCCRWSASRPTKMPADARPAKAAPAAPAGKVTGTVWLDFTRGGGGKPDAIDPKESALKGIKVEAVKDGKVVATATAGADGTFTLPAAADGAQLRLPAVELPRAVQRRRLARPDPGHPGDHRQRTSGCGPASRWC